jgi:hypothetical protein
MVGALLTASNGVLHDKIIFKKCVTFYGNRRFIHKIHLPVPILSQINPVHRHLIRYPYDSF